MSGRCGEDAVLQDDGDPVSAANMPATLVAACEVCGGGVKITRDVDHPVHEDCA